MNKSKIQDKKISKIEARISALTDKERSLIEPMVLKFGKTKAVKRLVEGYLKYEELKKLQTSEENNVINHSVETPNCGYVVYPPEIGDACCIKGLKSPITLASLRKRLLRNMALRPALKLGN